MDELLTKVGSLQSDKRLLEERIVRAEDEAKVSKVALQAVEKSNARKTEDNEKYKKRHQKMELERCRMDDFLQGLREEKTSVERSMKILAKENDELKKMVKHMGKEVNEAQSKKKARHV